MQEILHSLGRVFSPRSGSGKWPIGLLVCGLLLPMSEDVAAQTCSTTAECTGADACISGICVAPVLDPLAYASAASGRQGGYLGQLQFPALFDPPESCCFDYVGDPQPDDAFGSYIALLESFLGDFTQPTVNAALADGDLIKVVDWLELPTDLEDGSARLSLFDAHFGMGTDATVANQGLGEFFLRAESFGDYGALDQFNTATLSSGTLSAVGNQIGLRVFWDGVGDGLSSLTLLEPRLELPLSDSEIDCDGVCTVDEVRPGQTPSDTAGGKLGGILTADDYLAEVDAFYRSCSCAGIDPSLPVLVYGDDGNQYNLDCTDNTGDPSQCSDEVCSQLNSFCSVGTSLFVTFLDFDLNDNTVLDSFTVGLRLGLRGGQISGVSDIFASDFESGNTEDWSSAGRIETGG